VVDLTLELLTAFHDFNVVVSNGSPGRCQLPGSNELFREFAKLWFLCSSVCAVTVRACRCQLSRKLKAAW